MFLSKDWIPGQVVHADNLRAAKVCSAEATELPVWKRPPVSVANGICHPLGHWIPAQVVLADIRG